MPASDLSVSFRLYTLVVDFSHYLFHRMTTACHRQQTLHGDLAVTSPRPRHTASDSGSHSSESPTSPFSYDAVPLEIHSRWPVVALDSAVTKRHMTGREEVVGIVDVGPLGRSHT